MSSSQSARCATLDSGMAACIAAISYMSKSVHFVLASLEVLALTALA